MPTSDLYVLSILNKEELGRLLGSIVTENSPLTSVELTRRTALKGNKLRSLKYWAKRASLVNQGILTPEGKLVAIRDPYLETTVTDWLIHFHLSLGDSTSQKTPENLANWDVWLYFVYSFLPEHPQFSLNELTNTCVDIFTNEPQEKLKKAIRLVLRTYIEPVAIEKCKFLTQNYESFSSGVPNLSNPHTVGYLLAKTWERNFGSRNSVLVDDVLDAQLGLANVLGISREQLQLQLDILARHNIIEQRSAKPHLSGTKSPIREDTESTYQIIRCWDNALELLEEAYNNDIAAPNRPLIQSLESILNDDDVPDFSQFLEWVARLTPRQAYGLITSISFEPLLRLAS